MKDWDTFTRDACERPLAAPLFSLYSSFMNIKRYDHAPYYIYPYAQKWIGGEDTILTFLDWMVDAHESERNRNDINRSFY